MQNEFHFTKITLPSPKKGSKCQIESILCFVEFHAHELSEKILDFNFANLTILLPQNLQQSPIYQSKSISSLECLNKDIEWKPEYFKKIRQAFLS